MREGHGPRAAGHKRLAADHPKDGSLHPAHGTIDAPVIVVGASGTIGRAVVQGLVAKSRRVVAVAPDRDRLAALKAEHPVGVVANFDYRVGDDLGARRLAEQLAALDRPFAGVVVAFPIGRYPAPTERGRLLDLPADELRACLDRSLVSQFSLARHLIPLLGRSARNSSYVIIGGPGSVSPLAGYGHRSVARAATRMLAQVLHDEAQPLGVRVHLVSIDAPVRGESPGAHECPEWPSVGGIAGRVVDLFDRGAAHERADTIVACGRAVGYDLARAARGVFSSVPAFLDSLKKGSPS